MTDYPEAPVATFSLGTLALFAELLTQVTLTANVDPDQLEHDAHRVAQARRELTAALADLGAAP